MPRRLSEEATRKEMIDPQLEKAGWYLAVYLPPLSLQEEFAGVVWRVESLWGRMSEAERHAEGLFESLLNESFEG